MQLYPNIYRTLAPGPIVELRGYAAACRPVPRNCPEPLTSHAVSSKLDRSE